MVLNYAVVLQDPGHDFEAQPKFTLEVLYKDQPLDAYGCGVAYFTAGEKEGEAELAEGYDESYLVQTVTSASQLKPPKFISKDEFSYVLDKLEGYTKYLYFHVMGEPLLHPDVNELIERLKLDKEIIRNKNLLLAKK